MVQGVPAVNLVIRTITHTGAVQWLAAQNTSEAVTVIIPTGSHHLLSSKHLASAPGAAP